MEKIALDIVLLLPENIRQLCIELDRNSERSKVVSFEKGYQPHITLSMGRVNMTDVPNIAKKVETEIANQKPLQLSIIGFHEGRSSWLEVVKTDELSRLHEKINTIVKEYASYDAVPESFFEYDVCSPDQKLISWVNNYPAGGSDENYDPHISLGKETAFMPEFPIKFVADTIGMFHLGCHGTCKKELTRFTLN